MRTSLKSRLVTAVLALTAGGARADMVTEVSVGTGYQGNIFSDSTEVSDVNAVAGLGLKVYPTASMELAGRVSASGYDGYRDLSNLTGALSATLVPLPGAVRFVPTVSAGAEVRSFGDTYSTYDQVSAFAQSSFAARVTEGVQILTMASVSEARYPNSDYGSNRGYGLAGDLHFALPGANALAFGVDFSRRDYDLPLETVGLSPEGSSFGVTRTEQFDVAAVQGRLSRPIGSRIGLNLTGGHRFLYVEDSAYVPGFSVDNLSPWSDLWSGDYLAAGVKHFLPRQWVLNVGASFYEKEFVKALEIDETPGGSYRLVTREDRLWTVSASMEKLMSLGAGKNLRPVFSAGYRENRSSVDEFDFRDLWTSFTVSMTI